MAAADERDNTVLVVDDNAEVCELFGDILGMLGHRVACARNGQEALDYLQNNPPPRAIRSILPQRMSSLQLRIFTTTCHLRVRLS